MLQMISTPFLWGCDTFGRCRICILDPDLSTNLDPSCGVHSSEFGSKLVTNIRIGHWKSRKLSGSDIEHIVFTLTLFTCLYPCLLSWELPIRGQIGQTWIARRRSLGSPNHLRQLLRLRAYHWDLTLLEEGGPHSRLRVLFPRWNHMFICKRMVPFQRMNLNWNVHSKPSILGSSISGNTYAEHKQL